jgi:hypothetical protein
MDAKDKPKDQGAAAEGAGGQSPVVKSGVLTAADTPAGALARPQGEAGASENVELVVTLDGTTGDVVNVEKITDRQAGKREPLREDEWAQLLGMDLSGSADYYSAYAAYDPSAALALYYSAMDPTGLAAAYGDPYAAEEYAHAAGGGGSLAEQLVASGCSSVDAAYYQGIADFMAYSGY